MGPTSRAPLPAGDAAGKAVREMARCQRSLNRPGRCDGSERLKDEGSPAELWMRNREPARPDWAAAPEYQVQVEHSRAPSLAASSAEFSLYQFEALQHLRRFEFAFHECHRVREVASGTAVRGVEDDGGRV